MKRIQDLLNTNEEIKNVIKQDFIKMFLTSKITLISVALVILILILNFTLSVNLLFLLIPLTGLIIGIIPALLNRTFTSYYITSQKVIIEKGFIGRDYDIVKLDRVLDVNLDVSIVDSIFNTGCIKLCTANDNEAMILYNVKNPKQVIKLIQF